VTRLAKRVPGTADMLCVCATIHIPPRLQLNRHAHVQTSPPLGVQAVFEAAAPLALFHVQSVAAGGPGLGPNNAPGEPCFRTAAASFRIKCPSCLALFWLLTEPLPARRSAAGPDGTTPLGGLLGASLQRLIHGDAGAPAVGGV